MEHVGMYDHYIAIPFETLAKFDNLTFDSQQCFYLSDVIPKTLPYFRDTWEIPYLYSFSIR